MADVLKVSLEELHAAANRFKSRQIVFQTAYRTMYDAVSSLNDEDSKQFIPQFESIYKSLSQNVENMIEAVDELLREPDESPEFELFPIWSGLDEDFSPFA